MNLMITGASGFIGTNFIKSSSGYKITEVDLLTQNLNEIDFKEIDTVLHLAALVHQMKGAPVEEYFKVNRDLAYSVAQKAKESGVKHFVFMSTAKVYGDSTTGFKAWDESSACNPKDGYGLSKFEAEKLILNLEDENFKIAVVRSPLVYGVGVKANMFNLVKLVNKIPVLPLGGISNKRSVVYVGNLIALLNRIIELKASGIFIAGDSNAISTTDLVKIIAVESQRKLYLLKIPVYSRRLLRILIPSIYERLFGSLELDNANTNKILKFSPPYSVNDGVREMVIWYRNMKNI